jgi:predicted dehydrogenase
VRGATYGMAVPVEPDAITAPVRVGVLGLGYWGPNLVRNLSEIPAAEAAWMCDRRPEPLEVLGRRFPAVRRTQAFDEMLDDDSLEAVAIVTPVATHHDLAMRALEAGKHVYVEKPLAASSEEARDLIRAASERGLVLMPGHTFLYSPPVVRIRELIRSGELGDIYFISMSRVNLGLHQSDVSVIWDLGPHDFSILLYWLGQSPRRVVSMGRACIVDGQEDVAFINCAFDSGAIAHIELSWLAPSKLRRTTVVGSSKMVVYDDCSIEPVRVYDSGVMPRNPESFGEYLKYRTGDIVSPHIDLSEPLAIQMADFCHAVRSESTPRASAQLGLQVVHLIEAAERSLELCGRCADSTAVTRTDVEGVGMPGGLVGTHADLE